jgi:hypothetical protein
VIQIAIKTYNDLEVAGELAQWVPGIIYFAMQVWKVNQDIGN